MYNLTLQYHLFTMFLNAHSMNHKPRYELQLDHPPFSHKKHTHLCYYVPLANTEMVRMNQYQRKQQQLGVAPHELFHPMKLSHHLAGLKHSICV